MTRTVHDLDAGVGSVWVPMRDGARLGGRLYRTGDRPQPVLMAGSPDGGLSYQPGSRDQRVLDGRTDILRFTGPVLERDLEVTGPLVVTLHVATSAADTDFTAKLVDIHPSGRAMGIADGIVRARYRDGMDLPRPVVPGEVTEYRIDLGATSQVFKAGHRIRVDIASSNFPCFDRNPADLPRGQRDPPPGHPAA